MLGGKPLEFEGVGLQVVDKSNVDDHINGSCQRGTALPMNRVGAFPDWWRSCWS
jgi:hypothetical protein